MITELTISTGNRTELIDITAPIRDVVRESEVQSGVCVLFCPHTTAGLTLNENWDPAVRDDAIRTLDALVPASPLYRHAEGNSPAHIKAMLLGFSASIPIEAGDLVLGTWQGVFLGEFDGPRRRRVVVTILTEAPPVAPPEPPRRRRRQRVSVTLVSPRGRSGSSPRAAAR
ncbi:MAG TPA: secondary thiamine-phosphate synthase enzyme YjbQ [Armatimonadota bacterium]|nr:secondary thiamine-phosphate synthase enzyme YjbQ [Armatimonadota bacterium]